ncbi:sulfite exporter TauE/SafE family protein [Thalassospiraceae bacterium LMO-JJ14]|nr:sulfite exporter TauE/SafE family protein [Thalassospiraceae bacterium LMO-JJ14]
MPDLTVLLVSVPVVLIAGFIRGFTGFGGPLVLMPVLVLFLAPPSAAAIVLIIDICSNFGLLKDAFRFAARRTVLFTVASAMVAIPFGSYLMISADPGSVRTLIYAAVGVAALILLTGVRSSRPFKSYELVAGGAGAGGVMGATALGILIVPVLFSMSDAARTTRANLIVWVFFVSIFFLGVLFFENAFGQREMILGVGFAPIYLAGAVLGKKCFGQLDEEVFRRWVLFFLVAVSIAGLLFG